MELFQSQCWNDLKNWLWLNQHKIRTYMKKYLFKFDKFSIQSCCNKYIWFHRMKCNVCDWWPIISVCHIGMIRYWFRTAPHQSCNIGTAGFSHIVKVHCAIIGASSKISEKTQITVNKYPTRTIKGRSWIVAAPIKLHYIIW